jgi:hypothetical protein
MAFITFPERRGIKLGRIDGLLAGLEVVLKVRFQEAGLALRPELRRIEAPDRLAAVLQAVGNAASLDDVRALLTPAANP